MRLLVLQQFQIDIYNLLNTDSILKKEVNSIYLGFHKNSPTPFIAVEFLTANNLTSLGLITYELSFNIALFTNDIATNRIIALGEQILNVITAFHLQKQQNIYSVINLRFQSVSWHTDKLFITDKFNINYKSILQYCERYND